MTQVGAAPVRPEGLSTVVTHRETRGEVKQPRLDPGIGHDARWIIDGRNQVGTSPHRCPCTPPIVRTKEHTLASIHEGMDDPRVTPEHIQADAAEVAAGNTIPFPEAHPTVSPVQRQKETATRPPRLEGPRSPPVGPHGREEAVRITRVHDQI